MPELHPPKATVSFVHRSTAYLLAVWSLDKVVAEPGPLTEHVSPEFE